MTPDTPTREPMEAESYATEYIVSLHGNPLWEAIWATIKGWDLSRTGDGLYAGATGDDATRIYEAVLAALPPARPAEPTSEAVAALREVDAWFEALESQTLLREDHQRVVRHRALLTQAIAALAHPLPSDAPSGERITEKVHDTSASDTVHETAYRKALRAVDALATAKTTAREVASIALTAYAAALRAILDTPMTHNELRSALAELVGDVGAAAVDELREARRYVLGRNGVLPCYDDGTPRNLTALIVALEEVVRKEVVAAPVNLSAVEAAIDEYGFQRQLLGKGHADTEAAYRRLLSLYRTARSGVPAKEAGEEAQALSYADFLARVRPGYDSRGFFVVRFADCEKHIDVIARDIGDDKK